MTQVLASAKLIACATSANAIFTIPSSSRKIRLATMISNGMSLQCLLSFFMSLLLMLTEAANVGKRQRAFFGLVADDPEVNLLTDGILKRWGFPCEVHRKIKTGDGYLLKLFRIPHSRRRTYAPKEPRPVVLMQHGLMGNSEMWVRNLPEQDGAFLFADAGYDVWLGNFRGNMHSKRHVKWSPTRDKMKFWDFSWTEHALYDIPAMINYITSVSNASNIYYIGHSMGTLSGFVGFSENKEVGAKVKKFYALAPVLQVANVRGISKIASWFGPTINNALYYTGTEELTSTWLSRGISELACNTIQLLRNIYCVYATFLLQGPSYAKRNDSRVPVYFAHLPDATSRKNLAHLAQIANSGKIADFDYKNIEENMQHYGKEKPRKYDIRKMETPVGLFWAANDWMADNKDVRNVIPKFKNVFMKKYLKTFNHGDFLWSLDAANEVFIPILNDIWVDFYGDDAVADE